MNEEWTTAAEPTAGVQALLDRFLRGHLGIEAAVTHRWAAPVGFTSDGLPVAAEVLPGVWAVGGYGGTGNVMGALAARAVATATPRACPPAAGRWIDVNVSTMRVRLMEGAQVVQLFDSWVGYVAPRDYERSVLPYTKRVIDALTEHGKSVVPEGVPIIHFPNGATSMLDLAQLAGGDVLGVDWRLDMKHVVERVDERFAIQGNIDPVALFAPEALPGPTGESNTLQLAGRGVFVCISPWNFPLAIFTGQVAAALAAGNAVVAKPAEGAGSAATGEPDLDGGGVVLSHPNHR